MIGELLGGRYRVVATLGSGGFGHTYVAEDTQRPGKPRCVLKHLTFASPNESVLEQVRRLFRIEAETLERLGHHDQIPRLLAYFEESAQFYLVQEYINGHPLSREFLGDQRFSEAEAIVLLEDVLGILEFVHAENVIHRDIKPDNLIRRSDGRLVLIDFGAVKTINESIAGATGDTSLSLPVYTSGYAASEQCLGRPNFSSDLYSLGMVVIEALTGMRSVQLPIDYATSEVIWRDQVEVTEDFAAFLDQMVRYHYVQRFQSATEALQALKNLIAQSTTLVSPVQATPEEKSTTAVTTPVTTVQSEPEAAVVARRSPRRLPLLFGAVVVGLGLAWLGGGGLMPRSPILSVSPSPVTKQSPISTVVEGRISTGKRLLNPWQRDAKKQEGVDHLAAGRYKRAIAALEIARQRNAGDPETLIYLNNARIGNNKAHTIAVVVPLSKSLDSSLEILRGVAQSQDEVNQSKGIDGIPLKVAIASDDNDPEIARQIAAQLVEDTEVVGVVGHGSSDTSFAAAEVYQQQKLVMVSPVSSAVQLSTVGDYIFRTMPSDRQTARALSQHLVNTLKKRRVIIFHNSNSQYSQSLKNEFTAALFYNNAKFELVDEVDLSQPDFDAEQQVNQAIAQKAEVILLAADSSVRDQAIQLIQLNRRRLNILAGDSLFTPKLLSLARQEAVGMVLAVPIDLTASPFQLQFVKRWGNAQTASWRTALAYEASQAIVAGLQRDASRLGVQRTLSQPDFQVSGIQGALRFNQEGDRQIAAQLVTIVPAKSDNGRSDRYQFKPLPQRSHQ